MYYIVFAADDAYIPYTAVAITSIIKSTHIHDSQYENKPYSFNILTDYISETTQEKLQILQKELNAIYPCEIITHVMSDEYFREFPKIKGHSNYLAYYRLKMTDYLPYDLKKCLYLDGDILVRSDIRELFHVDLGDKIAGVVKDRALSHCVLKHKTTKDHVYLTPKDYYFNSGVLLVNLPLYKTQQIEQKVLEFLKNYHTRFQDQDALNVVINNRIVALPFKWNCMLSLKKEITGKPLTFIYESQPYLIAIERLEYESAKADPCIAHYACKPWESIYKYLDIHYQPIHYPHRAWWWDMALQTPAFSDIFQSLLQQQERRDLIARVDSLTLKLKEIEKKINRLRAPFNFFSSIWKKVRFWKH